MYRGIRRYDNNTLKYVFSFGIRILWRLGLPLLPQINQLKCIVVNYVNKCNINRTKKNIQKYTNILAAYLNICINI